VPKTAPPDVREKISSVFTRIEDVTYVGLAVLLAVSAVFLLISAAWSLIEGLSSSGPAKDLTVNILDQILLVLMIIEILSTVQVSFREHVLTPEPFLVRNAMFELGLLTVLIFSLVFSLHFLKKNRAATVERE
jgi:predicted Abi (CAAX) family protease